MTAAFVSHVDIGGGQTTGQLTASSASWSGAQAGDILVMFLSGNYLTGSSDAQKAVTVDSSWTLIGSEDRARRVTASPFTRGTLYVWWKRATASDLGYSDIAVGTGYVGTQREWRARGCIYRPANTLIGDIDTGGVDNVSDATATWQSPSATAPRQGLAITVYRTSNSSGPGVSVANGWINDYAGNISGYSQYVAFRSQAINDETLTGPTWVAASSHMAVVFCLGVYGGIFVDGAVH